MTTKKEKAVALKYEKKEIAPRVVAKGKGVIAEKIISLAKEHGVPIWEDKALVDILLKLDVGDFIPVELYKAVAEILVFVYKMEKKARERWGKKRH